MTTIFMPDDGDFKLTKPKKREKIYFVPFDMYDIIRVQGGDISYDSNSDSAQPPRKRNRTPKTQVFITVTGQAKNRANRHRHVHANGKNRKKAEAMDSQLEQYLKMVSDCYN